MYRFSAQKSRAEQPIQRSNLRKRPNETDEGATCRRYMKPIFFCRIRNIRRLAPTAHDFEFASLVLLLFASFPRPTESIGVDDDEAHFSQRQIDDDDDDDGEPTPNARMMRSQRQSVAHFSQLILWYFYSVKVLTLFSLSTSSIFEIIRTLNFRSCERERFVVAQTNGAKKSQEIFPPADWRVTERVAGC